MLFLSESIARKRRKLIQQVKRGTLTIEEAFRRALAFDPFDSLAMATVGLSYEARGDHEEARRYFWRALETEPAYADPYIFLTSSYSSSDKELSFSLSYLGLMRALSDPESMGPVAAEWTAGIRAELMRKIPGADEDTIYSYAETRAFDCPEEPERVTTLLAPYRLIQDVIDRPEEGMDREIVDRIVEQGSAFVPLLIGVLRGWARHPESDYVYSAEA